MAILFSLLTTKYLVVLACSITGASNHTEESQKESTTAPGGDASPAASDSSSSSSDSSTASSSTGGHLMPNSPEQRYREVLAVPVSRRPLFPGGILPVMVTDNQIIKELVEIRRQGAQAYVGAFLRKSDIGSGKDDGDSATATTLAMDDLLENNGGGGSDGAEGGKKEDEPLLSADDLHEIGTFAQVHTIVPHEKGAQLLLLGHRRLRATGVSSADPLRLSVLHLRDESYNPHDDMLKATTMEMISTLKELLHLHPLYNEQMRNFIQFGADFHDLSRLADLAASLTSGDSAALQAILEELSVPERAEKSLLLLRKEAELVKLQQDIGRRVEEKISKDQRKYFLMEQLRSIKKELGLEKDDKTALVQKFRERLEPVKDVLPEAASRVIEEELEKLSALEPASSEFSVTRNYLDWLTVLPWGRSSEERLDVDAARAVLDEDHYGLTDVKDRILEFIAVGRLRGSTRGKILCLVGPPGVGKTSIGRSIARSLDRSYFRFSVGGLSDVAEIKGHRRTYVGAMPGKMVQCLKATGTSNPLVLIDEIDKLGRGYQGDPASALLELLDPEQNNSFTDHYLDVPVDLSRVLFVCTANQLDTIPGPLLDRMEIIQLSGYTGAEKRDIARTYLEPQARADAGVPPGAVTVSDPALETLVQDYAREAGVRNLKKLLEKIYRKAAVKLVQQGIEGTLDKANTSSTASGGGTGSSTADSTTGEESSTGEINGTKKEGEEEEKLGSGSGIVPASPPPPQVRRSAEEEAAAAAAFPEPIVAVDIDGLKDYVGQPPYPSDRIYRDHMPAGVVTGLAWTPLGGATLYVEAASVEKGEGKGGLRATGQLGDVMKESTTIAHTYARKFMEQLRPDSAFFADHALHVHVPAGATPKDGPSAGCTLVTALLSLALDTPVKPDLAMTGEVTLTGKVLPIGGVKEKALAAKRSEVKHIIFPIGNKRDWEELGEEVRAGLEPHFVEEYKEIYELAFSVEESGGKVPPAPAATAA
jgi:Lon-like ATP-dependent protease